MYPDDVEGTVYLGEKIIIKGSNFCRVLKHSHCFTVVEHLLC